MMSFSKKPNNSFLPTLLTPAHSSSPVRSKVKQYGYGKSGRGNTKPLWQLEKEKQEALIMLIKKKMSSINLNNEGVIAISGFTGDETETLLGMIASKMTETQN